MMASYRAVRGNWDARKGFALYRHDGEHTSSPADGRSLFQDLRGDFT